MRQQTEYLCEPLAPEDFVVQPISDVSPPKWHLAHSTWFFENFLAASQIPGYRRFHPQYAYLFNSYYQHAGERWQRAMRGNLSRPTTEEILQYRKYVDEHMLRWLEDEGALSAEVKEVVVLGLQHEQQHQELLVTDLKYILGHNPLFPVYREPKPASGLAGVGGEHYLEMPEGLYEIGHRGDGFYFDNEGAPHRVFLEAYRVQDRLVTNREYVEFIEDGGYQHFAHWLSEGWDWVHRKEREAPLYWHKIEGVWHQYTLGGLRPVVEDEPVTHVSYYEADAFAAWKGKRLPTEQEWEAAARKYCPEIPGEANLCPAGVYHPRARQGKDYQFFGRRGSAASCGARY